MSNTRTWRAAGLLTLCALVGAGCSAQEAAEAEGQQEFAASEIAAAGDAPLYDNLGSYRRPVEVGGEAADYFQQGLRLHYAFNHAEAMRSYYAALGLDGDCAMCWWGIALASGPNINAGMDTEGGERAYRAIQRASRLAEAGEASAVGADLIAALATRYGEDPAAERAPLDSAYARAMGDLADRYPEDPDVQTLHAASLMNLSPWNYWSGDYTDRTPNPGTERILESLERALEVSPDHPGACHYYIHAVEAAYPERAVDCAERLAQLMPGAGHIVHMPGHIYIRVGRYADAVEANRHAVHEDESYIQDQSPTGLYPSAYYPHNYHFMAFAATMAGMSQAALEAARIVAPRVPFEVARDVYFIQNVVVLPQLTLLTFGDWEGVLNETMPDPRLTNATAMATYARGTALAALGRAEEARAALADLDEVHGAAAEREEDLTILELARHSLMGEIALREGDADAAVEHFRAAAAIEDEMLYEEPPLWYYPVRHSLGRALLEAGRPAEAEQAYRADLARFPANGWSLFGLAASLEAQGRPAEAAEARREFESAWANADVELEASRY